MKQPIAFIQLLIIIENFKIIEIRYMSLQITNVLLFFIFLHRCDFIGYDVMFNLIS